MKKYSLVALPVVLAASSLAFTGCTPTSSCTASFSGIYIQNHSVWDSVRVSCSIPPSVYVAVAEMDYRTNSEKDYTVIRKRTPIMEVPPKSGYLLNFSVVCLPGWYRGRVEATIVDKPGDARVTTEALGNELHVLNQAQCAK